MHRKNFIQIILLLLYYNASMTAQLSLCDNPSFELLININEDPAVYYLNNTSIVYNGTLYYTFDDGVHGQELWTSDNTEEGTVMLEDIYPGSTSSGIHELVLISDKLYFKADKGINGCELYSMDLSSSQPTATLVKDIVPGTNGSCPLNLIEVNGKLFFTAYSPTTGRELWISDGTANGTTLVQDIDGMESSSSMDHFFSAIDLLFFTVDLPDTGEELWVSDGTTNGTHILKDIYPGTRSFQWFSELQIIEFQNEVFFNANTDVNQSTLWKTDGTSLGTTAVVHDVHANTDFEPLSLTVVGNQLFLKGNKSTSSDRELFVCDGQQVNLVMDIFSGVNGSNPSQLVDVDGTLFFRANDGVHGSELWKSDGTSAGTQLIKDITPNGSSTIQSVTYVDGMVFFFIEESGSSTKLWKSGGTDPSTIELYDLPGNVEAIAAFEMIDQFFFVITLDEFGEELWWSDGTPSTTGLLQDIAVGSASSRPHNFNIDEDNNSVYFFAHTEQTGMQLYNASQSGPIEFLGEKSNLGGHSRGIDARLETRWGNKGVLYVNKLGSENISHWITDGTKVGTYEANFGGLNINFRSSFADAGSHFMFIYQDEQDDFRLMQSDGTVSETSLVTNFGDISYAFLVTTIEESAIFYQVNNNQVSFWSIRPNQQPILLVDDLGEVEIEEEWAENLFYDGYFYFFSIESNEVQMWKTDGTQSGTSLVHSFDDVRVEAAHALDDKIVIMTSTNSNQRIESHQEHKSSFTEGPQIWVSDGSLGGTALVTELDVELRIETSSTLNNKVVFATTESGQSNFEGSTPQKSIQNGLEGIWSTDGTTIGTMQLQSLQRASILNTVSDKVYFTSAQSLNGRKLYSTDGSLNGTNVFEFEYNTPVFISEDRLNSETLSSFGGQPLFSNTIGCQGLETYILDEQNEALNVLFDVPNLTLDAEEVSSPISLGDKTIMLLDNRVTGPELYALDCACNQSLMISDAHMESGKYHAGQEMTILGHSRPGTNILLKAGKSIEFERGFTAGNFSQFTVENSNCDQ